MNLERKGANIMAIKDQISKVFRVRVEDAFGGTPATTLQRHIKNFIEESGEIGLKVAAMVRLDIDDHGNQEVLVYFDHLI